MLRFTKRQYESVLRRMGVTESGLAYEDTAKLVTLVDDLRGLQGPPPIPIAYTTAAQAGIAANYPFMELPAPRGGCWVTMCIGGAMAADWFYGIAEATQITGGHVHPTVVDMTDTPAQAEPEYGPGTVIPDAAVGIRMLTADANNARGFPMFVRFGRRFWIGSVTQNDPIVGTIFWNEPGEPG